MNQPEPNPKKWTKLTYEQINNHKQIFCSEYNKCLSKMIKEDAKSWTCLFCTISKKTKNAERISDINPFSLVMNPEIPVMFTNQ